MTPTRRVLVLGSGGMLGSACVRFLRRTEPSWRVASAARGGNGDYQFDVESGEGRLIEIIEEENCDFVINCVAVLASGIDEQSNSVARAALVNSWFPHALADVAGRRSCKVLHVSTDGVFSGRGATVLDESAVPDALDVYGRSKLLGESAAPQVLTVRCSIIGRDRRGRGITEWYLGADPSVPVRGFVDYRWTPVTVSQLARFFHGIIATGTFDRMREDGSVVHFAPNPGLSKFEYLALLRRGANRGAPIEAAIGDSGPICRELTSTRHFAEVQKDATTDWDVLITELLHPDQLTCNGGNDG